MSRGPYQLAYSLLGGFAASLAPSFKGLQQNLLRAGLNMPAPMYLSFMLFVAGVAFAVIAGTVLVLNTVLLGMQPLVYVVGLMLGMVGAIVGFAITYSYPSLLTSKNRRTIDENLAYSLSFMGILSSAGIPPDRVFRALATLEEKRQVGLGGEAKRIYRDLELLGANLVSALKAAAERRISPLFSGVLEGLTTTIQSGGDFTKNLEAEARSMMRMRAGIIKEFLESLVMLSEMYMALMVAFPLILIVMLVVMSSIGGGAIGGTSPDELVPIIIYGMVPMVGVVLMFYLDAVTPRE